MARIEYPRNRSIYGIFHIEKRDLEELAQILTERAKALRKLKSQEIRTEVEKSRLEYERALAYIADEKEREQEIQERLARISNHYPLNREKFEWVIHLSSGEKLIGSDLQELLNHESLSRFNATKVEASIECGRFDAQFEIETGWVKGNDVSIVVSPQHRAESNRIVREVETWAREHALVKPLYWWHHVGFFLRFFFLLAIMIPINIGTQVLKEDIPQRSAALHHEIEAILSEGISAENEHRAMSLLLESQLPDKPVEGISVDSVETRVRRFANVSMLTASLAIYLILCFPPRTIIGIGKNTSRLILLSVDLYQF